MNEFVEQFLIECRELVEQTTADLLALENAPGDAERLDSAFRGFHTLKGAAGIVDFEAMGRALHAAENVLEKVRAGHAPVTPPLIGHALASLDQVTQWLDAMEGSGEIPPSAEREADAIVQRFATRPGSAEHAASEVQSQKPAPAGAHDLPPVAHALLTAQIELLAEPASEGAAGRMAAAGRVAASTLRALGREAEAQNIERIAASGDGSLLPEAIDDAVRGELRARQAGEAVHTPRDAQARVLRVDVERVDALVKLAGELTVAKNAVGHAAQLAAEGADPQLLSAMLKEQHAQISRLVAELQSAVLNIRVLPLRHVFQRFPRLVREMADMTGKPARLVTEGDATEADKSIVEILFEPLLHVLRNAVDHGVENAETRARLGKPAVATIHLRAVREGEHVIVEVADDGRGLDAARIRDVAAERAVASPDEIAAMSEGDVFNLIFAPGFSTAETTTNLSGRGVGMDAVRTTIERWGGRVSVHSAAGNGTRVRFALPFTVMMTRVLTVEAGGQAFGIPLDAVLETVRVPRDEIAAVGAARAFVLRNRTVPVVELSGALGQEVSRPVAPEVNIVVASIGGQLGGIEVERLGERMDVMLKSVDGLLAGMPGIAGTTLLGDGRVLIVLDLADLFRQ